MAYKCVKIYSDTDVVIRSCLTLLLMASIVVT